MQTIWALPSALVYWAVAFGLGAFLASHANAHAQDGPESVHLWEAPAASLSALKRDGWKQVQGRGQVREAVVLENGRATIAVAPGTPGILVRFKEPDPASNRDLEISIFYGNSTRKVESVSVVECSTGRAEISVRYEAGAGSGSVTMEGSSATVRLSGAKGSVVRAAGCFSYAFRPDFFGTDIVYSPTQKAFAAAGRVAIPVSSYLAAVCSDHSAVLCSWPDAEQIARLSTRIEDNGARFVALDVDLTGEKSWACVSLLHAPGAFFSKDLRGVAYSEKFQDKKDVRQMATMDLPWRPPFDARWNAIIYYGERGAEDHLSLPVAQTWPLQIYAPFNYFTLTGQKAMEKQVTWRKEGKFWDNDGWHNHPLRAAVADGQDLTLILESIYTKHELAFVFPLDRTASTPPGETTLADLLRAVFGDRFSEILDVEGQRMRWEVEPGKVCAVAACPGHDRYFQALQQRRDIKGAIEAARSVEYFLTMMDRRTREYLAFGDEIKTLCDEAAKKDASLQPMAAALKKAAQGFEGRWRSCEGRAGNEDRTKEYFDQLCGILETNKDVKVINDKIREAKIKNFREMGLNYDFFVSAARKMADRMIAVAALQGTGEPERVAFGREMLKQCHAIVRNGVPKDTVYVEMHWVPFGCESMQTMPGYNGDPAGIAAKNDRP